MDLARFVLLLVAVASQSKSAWCGGDPPPEKPGQITSILDIREHFQWQVKVEGDVVRKPFDWNPQVTLRKAWTNEVTTFHMTCAQKDDQFRAIIFITKIREKQLNYYPIKTLDVKTCQDTLLESVTIVKRQWKTDGKKIGQVVIVKQDADCKMDVFDANRNKVKEENKTCPPTNDRGSPSNGSGYVNGWKEKTNFDTENFKYFFFIKPLDYNTDA